MGIIQKQSIRSGIFIMIGFAIGGINTVFLAPRILGSELFGLTRVITDAGLILAGLCTFGALAVIYKFFPFYRSYLAPKKNDLPFITLMVCVTGMIIMFTAGYMLRGIVVRKFSANSPLFVQYSYLVYPFALCMLFFMWLESFAWTFKKSVPSNALKELFVRIIFTVLLILAGYHFISTQKFIVLFSMSYFLPAVILFFVLRHTKEFYFNPGISTVTKRLQGKMALFGLYLFGAQFLNLLSRSVDTFLLAAKSGRGLTDAAVFTIASYMITLLDVPQRSMNAITVPVLVDSWRIKNMKNIADIYSKSVSNMLVIGLVLFSLVWLNIHELAAFLGKNFSGIENIVLLLGIAKIIDLGTGVNAQIISTSNYWRVDFTTNVIFVIISLPLNYTLISYYGLMGAAYATLIAQIVYNVIRLVFIWKKFRLQPYKLAHLLTLGFAVAAILAAYCIPNSFAGAVCQSCKTVLPVINIAIRSLVFLGIFVPAVYFAKVSTELNKMIEKRCKMLWNKV